MRVALIGGGTAGHLAPGVAVAEALQAVGPDAELLLVAANRDLDHQLLDGSDWPHCFIDAEPFPYRLELGLLTAALAMVRARRQAHDHLRAFGPDVTIGTGGYVALAGVPAAHRLGCPIVLHAPDALPDRASRSLARLADLVTLGYASAQAYFPRCRTVHTGVPIRRAVLAPTRAEGLARLGLAGDRRTLVVMGGSQGAQRLNEAVAAALPRLLERGDLQVLHLTGTRQFEAVHAATAGFGPEAGYHPVAYLGEMGLVLAAADLVVSRAGANSTAEIMARGVPAVLVPYPHAGGHQRLNALPFAEAGAAVMVGNEELDGERLVSLVAELLGDPARLAAMQAQCVAMGRPQAAEEVARLALQLAADPKANSALRGN